MSLLGIWLGQYPLQLQLEPIFPLPHTSNWCSWETQLIRHALRPRSSWIHRPAARPPGCYSPALPPRTEGRLCPFPSVCIGRRSVSSIVPIGAICAFRTRWMIRRVVGRPRRVNLDGLGNLCTWIVMRISSRTRTSKSPRSAQFMVIWRISSSKHCAYSSSLTGQIPNNQ